MEYKHNIEFKADAIYLGDELIDALYIGDDLLYQNLAEKLEEPDNIVYETVSELSGFNKFEYVITDTNSYYLPADIPDHIFREKINTDEYFNIQGVDTNNVKRVLSFPKANKYSLRNSFNREKKLIEFKAPLMNTEPVSDYMFFLCDNPLLEYVYIGELNFKNATDLISIFCDCPVLTQIEGNFSNLGKSMQGIMYSPLDRATALRFINAMIVLPEGESQFIMFSQTTYNQLSEEDIALGTEKGWSVVS